MIRLVLTDAQWEKMAPHCLGKATDAGRSGKDNQLFLEAILWKAREADRSRGDEGQDDLVESLEPVGKLPARS